METSLPQLLAQASGNAMQVIVAKKMRVPLDDAEFKDLNVVQPGDSLVAINGVDVDNLAVSELVDRLDAAAMASLESPCTLLFARHDYNDVKALHPFLSTLPEYGDVMELHYGDATWFYNESGILFANHYDAIADFFSPTTESTLERAFMAMADETLSAKHKLDKTLNQAMERIWEHFCDLVFLEHLEREMQLPQLPHLNLREDARHLLYSRRYTAAPPWPFELKWQSSRKDYSLQSLLSASTTIPRGIAVVATSSESNIAAGDVLVGINHVFLTTSALSFQKQWRRVQATTSLARPTTFFFLRSQYRKIVSAINTSTRCWQVPWTLFDYTLLDVVETYLPSRFPPRLAKLAILGAESNAWETHTVDNVVCYRHSPTNRVYCDHPMHILLLPTLQTTHTRLRWSCWRLAFKYRRKRLEDRLAMKIQHVVAEREINDALDMLVAHAIRPSVVWLSDDHVDELYLACIQSQVDSEEDDFVASLARFRFLHRLGEPYYNEIKARDCFLDRKDDPDDVLPSCSQETLLDPCPSSVRSAENDPNALLIAEVMTALVDKIERRQAMEMLALELVVQVTTQEISDLVVEITVEMEHAAVGDVVEALVATIEELIKRQEVVQHLTDSMVDEVALELEFEIAGQVYSSMLQDLVAQVVNAVTANVESLHAIELRALLSIEILDAIIDESSREMSCSIAAMDALTHRQEEISKARTIALVLDWMIAQLSADLAMSAMTEMETAVVHEVVEALTAQVDANAASALTATENEAKSIMNQVVADMARFIAAETMHEAKVDALMIGQVVDRLVESVAVIVSAETESRAIVEIVNSLANKITDDMSASLAADERIDHRNERIGQTVSNVMERLVTDVESLHMTNLLASAATEWAQSLVWEVLHEIHVDDTLLAIQQLRDAEIDKTVHGIIQELVDAVDEFHSRELQDRACVLQVVDAIVREVENAFAVSPRRDVGLKLLDQVVVEMLKPIAIDCTSDDKALPESPEEPEIEGAESLLLPLRVRPPKTKRLEPLSPAKMSPRSKLDKEPLVFPMVGSLQACMRSPWTDTKWLAPTRWALPRLELDRIPPRVSTAQRKYRKEKRHEEYTAACRIQKCVKRFIGMQRQWRRRERLPRTPTLPRKKSPKLQGLSSSSAVHLPHVSPQKGKQKIAKGMHTKSNEDAKDRAQTGLTEEQLTLELRALNQALELKAIKKQHTTQSLPRLHRHQPKKSPHKTLHPTRHVS
ncbi:hypothetical protein Ae201684_013092 [Aphanomyces euteiches]|uniref:PDZ domain-containing protein n=2 Tax=Aphanomyces euteiches TaxID=100861 RepID=A0A6G0WPR6_9STRA|nr:hypothetical protein Ae201684_013092 [Aphanomyces euteiches]